MPRSHDFTVRAAASVAIGLIGRHGVQLRGCAGALSFGRYNGVTQAKVETITTLTLTCRGPGTLNYTVTLSGG